MLLAGFANLILVAVVAPAGRAPAAPAPAATCRARSRDDYAGTALMCALASLLAVGGRGAPARRVGGRARRERRCPRPCTTTCARTRRLCGVLRRADAVPQADFYRACVPSGDVRRALCLFVDTDQRPAVVRADTDRTPTPRRFP